MITKEQIEKTAGIPTEEIKQDIADTVSEIETLKAELAHLETTPTSARDYRLNMIKADARRTGIRQRTEFIEKLQQILRYREGSQ